MAASHTLETLKAVDGKTHTLHSTAHSDFTTHKKSLFLCMLFVFDVATIDLLAAVTNQFI